MSKIFQDLPDPWEVVEHSWSDTTIYDENRKVIARLSIADEATEETQEELEIQMGKNARLIEAAPLMFDMLKAIRRALKEAGIGGTDIETDINLLEQRIDL